MLHHFLDFIEPLTRSLAGWQLALVVATAFVGGFMRGFVGFGSALVVIMVFSAIFGPLVAVPVAALLGLPSAFQLLPDALRDSERAFVLPFGAAVFLAAPLGTYVLVIVDPAHLKIAISLFVLAAVVQLHRGWHPPGPQGHGLLAVTGAAAGLVQGAAGVGGPLVVTMALARQGTAESQRGNVIAAVTVLALSTQIPLWIAGLFTQQVLVMGLLLFLLYAGGTWAGARFFRGSGQRHFRNAALVLLAAIGVVTLALALRDAAG